METAAATVVHNNVLFPPVFEKFPSFHSICPMQNFITFSYFHALNNSWKLLLFLANGPIYWANIYCILTVKNCHNFPCAHICVVTLLSLLVGGRTGLIEDRGALREISCKLLKIVKHRLDTLYRWTKINKYIYTINWLLH